MTKIEAATTGTTTGLSTPAVFLNAAKNSPWVQGALDARAEQAKLDTNTNESTIDGDQTAAGALRRERVRGAQKASKDNTTLGLGLLSGVNGRLQNFAQNTVLSSVDDNSRQAVNTLQQVAGAARTIIQMMGGVGLSIFTAEAVMTGADLRSDVRKAFNNGQTNASAQVATAEIAEEGLEAGARTTGRAGRGLARAAFRKAAKMLPFAGTVATGYFAFREVDHFMNTGQENLARAAAVVGLAESVGTIANLFTFGLASDFLREATRSAFVRFGGAEYEQLQVSDVRYVATTGRDIAREEFARAAEGVGAAAPVARVASNLIGAPSPVSV